jgi:hypothetical protein
MLNFECRDDRNGTRSMAYCCANRTTIRFEQLTRPKIESVEAYLTKQIFTFDDEDKEETAKKRASVHLNNLLFLLSVK